MQTGLFDGAVSSNSLVIFFIPVMHNGGDVKD